MHPKETLTADRLHDRLRQISAQFMPQRSNGKMHVYWSAPMRQWIKVVRAGNNVTLSYHATCPCSGG